MSTRSYDSPVRERRKTETRTQILEALVDVVLNDGIHAFSVQRVAERAGVSHRTVYRHFPTREALLDGLSELLSGQPDSVIVDHAAIVQSFRAFDASADLVRAYVITSLALGIEPSGRPERTRQMQAAFVARFPNLDPEEVRVTFSTLRVLVSSRAWHLLRQLGVDGERGGAEVARVFDLVVADLERRNAAACKE
jgi:AcrR family transcriptional regulator